MYECALYYSSIFHIPEGTLLFLYCPSYFALPGTRQNPKNSYLLKNTNKIYIQKNTIQSVDLHSPTQQVTD